MMSRRRPFAYSSAILVIIASSTKLAMMFLNGVVSVIASFATAARRLRLLKMSPALVSV